jgi:photosystem II stability/assembly factor-like uncharacterized protein
MSYFGKILFFSIFLLCLQTAKANWVKQNSNTLAWLRDVYFFDEKKGFIVGNNGTFLETEDGGKTWKRRKNFTDDAILQIVFLDSLKGWLLCERDVFNRGTNAVSYLMKTTDGGINWEKVELKDSGRTRLTRIFFNAKGKGWAIGEGGAFFELQADGQTWEKSPSPIRYLLLDGVFTDNARSAVFGANGTIYFSDDGGMTWNNANIFGDKPSRFNSAFFINSRNGWAVGTQGKIFQTMSGGKTWREQTSGVTNDLNDIFFLNTAEGFAVGNEGTILYTKTAGNIWMPETSKVRHRLEKVFFIGAKGFAVGFGGTILKYEKDFP